MQENSSSGTPHDPFEKPLTEEQAKHLFLRIADQLHAIARGLSRRNVHQTLQPTAVVNEAYIRLFGKGPRTWNDEAHFLRYAARTIRNILLDHKRRTDLRTRILPPSAFDFEELLVSMESRCGGDLLAMNDVLDLLAKENEEIAEYVSLRFFTGRTNAETTRVLGICERSGDGHWAFARAWLKLRLQE